MSQSKLHAAAFSEYGRSTRGNMNSQPNQSIRNHENDWTLRIFHVPNGWTRNEFEGPGPWVCFRDCNDWGRMDLTL